jgi:chaperonin GroES
MSAKVQPLGSNVVAQAEEAQTKTASGLYLPGGAAEKPKVAKVVAVGPEATGVKVGDRIIYKNDYEATNVKVDGEEFIVVSQVNIVATVN